MERNESSCFSRSTDGVALWLPQIAHHGQPSVRLTGRLARRSSGLSPESRFLRSYNNLSETEPNPIAAGSDFPIYRLLGH